MRNFTEDDLERKGTQYPTIYADRAELVYSPLEWQKQGLRQTASGYGSKLTRDDKISFEGKLFRLYCTIFSNSGSVWFETKGRKIYVH